MLAFPMLAEYGLLEVCGQAVILAHGHQLAENRIPPFREGDIFLHGHTHVPRCEESCGVTFLNPGSVSIPKSGSRCGYITLEKGTFLWKTLAGETFRSWSSGSRPQPSASVFPETEK